MKINHAEIESLKFTDSPSPEHKNNNQKIVKSVYKALRDGDTKKKPGNLVAGRELEWWYHGPRHCQYMKEMLTAGKSTTNNNNNKDDFKFRPRRMRAIGDSVIIVEGWEWKGKGKGECYYYWVHLWRFKDNGVIAQLREYLNTLITLVVRDSDEDGGSSGGGGVRLWRSTSLARAQGSLPELVLGI